MTKAEVADLQALTREFREYKELTSSELADIKASLNKMLPTKAVIVTGKVLAWVTTTVVAIIAIIAYAHHK